MCSQSAKLDDEGIIALSDPEMKILALIEEVWTIMAFQCLNMITEMVARVMHTIIERFVAKTATADAESQQHQPMRSNEWLTDLSENSAAGTLFADKYMIESLLGSGGTGSVFKAKHLYMDRYVALKLLRRELCQDRLTIRNFQHEAQAIAKLQHKNIVGIYDFGISVNIEPFLVMEYVDGSALDILSQKNANCLCIAF